MLEGARNSVFCRQLRAYFSSPTDIRNFVDVSLNRSFIKVPCIGNFETNQERNPPCVSTYVHTYVHTRLKNLLFSGQAQIIYSASHSHIDQHIIINYRKQLKAVQNGPSRS